MSGCRCCMGSLMVQRRRAGRADGGGDSGTQASVACGFENSACVVSSGSGNRKVWLILGFVAIALIVAGFVGIARVFLNRHLGARTVHPGDGTPPADPDAALKPRTNSRTRTNAFLADSQRNSPPAAETPTPTPPTPTPARTPTPAPTGADTGTPPLEQPREKLVDKKFARSLARTQRTAGNQRSEDSPQSLGLPLVRRKVRFYPNWENPLTLKPGAIGRILAPHFTKYCQIGLLSATFPIAIGPASTNRGFFCPVGGRFGSANRVKRDGGRRQPGDCARLGRRAAAPN